ncbi:DDE superfamily endonuclease [Streptomyces sp. TLI_105]|nr:DDE superfamily endonuclease [Streptomyces sp. TLI_105]
MAGMSCFKQGRRSRLFYGFRVYRGRRSEPKGLAWRDYRDLITRARIQLGGPIVLVWDNLRAHLMSQMRAFIEANADWLTVFRLPSYAPGLHPQEGIWALVKTNSGLGDCGRGWFTGGSSPAGLLGNTHRPATPARRPAPTSLHQVRYNPENAWNFSSCVALDLGL